MRAFNNALIFKPAYFSVEQLPDTLSGMIRLLPDTAVTGSVARRQHGAKPALSENLRSRNPISGSQIS
jgi:hypothetical protein